ncbi:MAG: NAD-dependent epimerase/dehydratase family protein [Patescibacteria group bacterium]
MHIGITGSNGFIARHIAETLERGKNVRLHYFDLPKCDLLNMGDARRFVRGMDAIVHAAAVNRGTDEEIIAGTVVATHNLIRALRDAKSKAKVIFLSSIQAETDTLYGQCKRLGEIMLEDRARRGGHATIVFRLPNVFGEGSRPFYNSAVATFCHQAAKNQPFIIHRDSKDKPLPLIYVKDAARRIADECFRKRSAPFSIARMTPRGSISVGDLAGLIRSFKTMRDPAPLRSKLEKDLYRTYRSFI